MAQPLYNPSAYSLPPPPSSTRAWSFHALESRPIAYINSDTGTAIPGINQGTKGTAAERSDRILREILRAANIPYNPASLRKNPRLAWENVARDSSAVKGIVEGIREVGVGEKGFHEQVREHGRMVEVTYDGLAEINKYQHRLTFEQWLEAKETGRQRTGDGADGKAGADGKGVGLREKKRREMNEKAYSAWLSTRGRRKMEIIPNLFKEEDSGVVEQSEEEVKERKDRNEGENQVANVRTRCEQRAVQNARLQARPYTRGACVIVCPSSHLPSPQAEYNLWLSKRGRRKMEIVNVKSLVTVSSLQHLAEEKAARSAEAHGVFMAWLAEKKIQRVRERKEKVTRQRMETVEKRRARGEKWKKNYVVNCAQGSQAKDLRKLGLNKIMEVSDSVKYWVRENWGRWQVEPPEWFDEDFRALVKDIIPNDGSRTTGVTVRTTGVTVT